MKDNKPGWIQELFVIEISPSNYNGEHVLQIKKPGVPEKTVSRLSGPDQPFKVSIPRVHLKSTEVRYCSPSKINELIGLPLDSIMDSKSKCKCKSGGDPVFVDHQDSGFKEIRCSKCGGHINTKGARHD